MLSCIHVFAPYSQKSRQPQLPTSPASSLSDSEGLALCSPSTSAVREDPIDKVSNK